MGAQGTCGHAIIAPTKMDGAEVTLRIDGPPGPIVSTAHRKQGVMERVIFRNVPSFVAVRLGEILINDKSSRFDIAYGGAFYAFIERMICNLNWITGACQPSDRDGKSCQAGRF